MSAIAKNNVFYGAVEPIPINDGSTSATETWSGQYLNQEFSAINSTLGKYNGKPVIYKAINAGGTQGATFDTGLPTDRSFVCKVVQIEQNTIREFICGKRFSGAGFASNCNYVTENATTKTIMLTAATTYSDRWFFEYMEL